MKPERNTTQQEALNRLLKGYNPPKGMDPLNEKWSFYEVQFDGANDKGKATSKDKAKSFNGDPLFQNHLYLFNIVIALEWIPSKVTIQQLRLAAQKASHFLYDVTYGNMAIGCVLIGGPDLMEAADIQVMASNRLHPRSWVDALNEKNKFMPIRIGRGLWQKNSDFLLPWDTPEGYRALIHEWGHYAFGLSDEYLTKVWLFREPAQMQGWGQAEIAVAVPQVALPVETVMASTQISEFARRTTIIKFLKTRFPNTTMDERKALEGPDALPLQLPSFTETKFDLENKFDIVLDAEEIRIWLPDYRGAAYWVYILQQHAPGDQDLPRKIIAQGKIGARERESGFRLLGAKAGDQIVVVSQAGNTVRVLSKTIQLDGENLAPDGWDDVTPSVLKGLQPFFVDVIPIKMDMINPKDRLYPTHADVRVAVALPGVGSRQLPDKVALYPSGNEDCVLLNWDKSEGLSDSKGVSHLDGHVLLVWFEPEQSPSKRLFIASYSQGGGPLTSGGRGTLPITAGSSEGNAMVFFRDNADSNEGTQPRPDPGLRIVTTMMPVGRPTLDDGSEARSYIFSLAANKSLAPYPASLVLFYDREAPAQHMDLLIYRWDSKRIEWIPLRTYDATEFPYLAIPLSIEVFENAPGLLREQPSQVERYRVFLTPRQ